MIYQVDNIMRDVRVCMDENGIDTALITDGNEDTLQLNDIIRSKIVEAVEKVHKAAPYDMVENGHNFSNAGISWRPFESGEVLLPNDFMRLVVFQMSDWERAVYTAITPADPQYAKCRSRVKALRGTPQRPVCAIGMRADGKVLEFYSCRYPNATISRAVYLPYPTIDSNNGVDISEPCYTAVIYATAGMTMLTYGEKESSALLLENVKALLNVR